MFIQEFPDGRASVSVLAIPHIGLYGPSREAAIDEVREKLLDYAGKLSRKFWDELVFSEEQELRTIELDLMPRGKMPHEPIPITVNLLVTTEQGSRGIRYVISAPRIDDFQLIVTDPDQIETQARAGLTHYLRKWRTQNIADVDLKGAESLATLAITLPLTAARDEGDGTASADSNPVLRQCGVNLSEQASTAQLQHADRREALVEQMLLTLASGPQSSIMLVGPGDVGKTSLIHEVVERIHGGDVPPSLKGRAVWFVTANNLLAGQKYIGEWQGRMQKLVREVRTGRQILYMGDPYELLVAARWSGSDDNMGRFLRPYLDGDLTLICETTAEGYAAALKLEPSFVHAFRRIDVPEPNESDTIAIVHAEARRIEQTLDIRIDPGVSTAIIDLTRRFTPYRAFPGKAVRLLQSLARELVPNDERLAGLILDRAAAIRGFARVTGLPELLLVDESPMHVSSVRDYFQERLLGQPDAVETLVDLLTVLKARLNDPTKPLGVFMFVGPTGVGKTEAAKVLAEFLFGSRDRLLRFDMSEYASADALPRLIGTAWKPDSEGELTRRVREQPFAVVLLDELEKAHTVVFDALLQVLGEGRLSDAGGRTADFRNTIIIMTSNLGSSRREMQSIGFGQTNPSSGEDEARTRAYFQGEAESFFRPEFVNRIGRIVPFRPLTPGAIRLIARRELGKLLMREGIVRRNLLVEIDDAVIEQLVAQGFHPLYGARPLQREIESMVMLPLARVVVEQATTGSQLLRFSVHDGHIDLQLVALDTPEDTFEYPPDEPRPSDQRLEHDIAVILRSIEELRERATVEEAGSTVQHLRRDVSALLRRTREPGFWDEPEEARDVLSRVYHVEGALKRFDDLVEHVDYLFEKGRQIRRNRDRRSVPPFAQDVERLRAELEYVSMELAGTGAGTGHNVVLLRITAVSRDSETWAADLALMYSVWATRKGYEWTMITPDDETEGASSYEGSLALRGLYLKGNNVYEFLRGEAGLHKLHTGAAEERERSLARVAVLMVPEHVASVDDLPRAEVLRLLGGAEPTPSVDNPAVVRTYSEGRHRYVRDLRTGVRLNDVTSVLRDGEIDAFLLATIRQTATTASLE